MLKQRVINFCVSARKFELCQQKQCLYTKNFPIDIVQVYVARVNRVTFLGSYCYEILNHRHVNKINSLQRIKLTYLAQTREFFGSSVRHRLVADPTDKNCDVSPSES